jgi:hypothetical protein
MVTFLLKSEKSFFRAGGLGEMQQTIIGSSKGAL